MVDSYGLIVYLFFFFIYIFIIWDVPCYLFCPEVAPCYLSKISDRILTPADSSNEFLIPNRNGY